MMGMDVLRALHRVPGTLDALLAEIGRGTGADQRIAAWGADIEKIARDPELAERQARQLTEMIALGIQASVMARCSPAPVLAAFLDSRLDKGSRRTFGTLEASHDLDAILKRSSLASGEASRAALPDATTDALSSALPGDLARSLEEVTRRAIEQVELQATT